MTNTRKFAILLMQIISRQNHSESLIEVNIADFKGV